MFDLYIMYIIGAKVSHTSLRNAGWGNTAW